jgi:hypothetical protein
MRRGEDVSLTGHTGQSEASVGQHRGEINQPRCLINGRRLDRRNVMLPEDSAYNFETAGEWRILERLLSS